MVANEIGGGVMALLLAVGVIAAVVLLIAWIILPFAMLGTKPILRELLAEHKKATAALEHLARSSDEQRKLLATLAESEKATSHPAS